MLTGQTISSHKPFLVLVSMQKEAEGNNGKYETSLRIGKPQIANRYLKKKA